MKNWKSIILLIIIVTIIGTKNVLAKDTVYSINKYQEENLQFIKNSYNKKGQEDGFVVGGYYLKNAIEQENDEIKDYQIILAKYKETGESQWTYSYGKTREDKMDDLQYTYDENNKIDGYLITLEKTYDIIEENNLEENRITEESQILDNSNSTFLKIGLDGKLVWEKNSGLNRYEKIKKIIISMNEENQPDGYIALGIIEENNKKIPTIIKYDKEMNVVWQKEATIEENQELEYIDICPIQEEKKVVGYALIRSSTISKKEKKVEIVRINMSGEEETIIDNTLAKYTSYFLQKANNSIILRLQPKNLFSYYYLFFQE